MTVLTDAELDALLPPIPEDGGEFEAWLDTLEREWHRHEAFRLAAVFAAGAVSGASLVVLACASWLFGAS